MSPLQSDAALPLDGAPATAPAAARRRAADEPAPPLTRDEAVRWARTGVLAAFALVLSYAETFVPLPIPVPGAKLGLANAAVLLALDTVGVRGALAVAVIKMLVTGLLFGSPAMIPYSAAGTALSFAVMALLGRVPGLSVVPTSMFGAVAHVAGQLAVASLMLGTPLVWYSLPVLTVVALVTGALTGKLVACLLPALGDGREATAPGASSAATAPVPFAPAVTAPAALPFAPRPRRAPLGHAGTRAVLVTLLAYSAGLFLVDNVALLGAAVALAAGAALAARLRPRDLARALAPLLSVLVMTAVAQVAYLQQGPVLLTLGPVTVTEAAALATATLVLRLVGLMTAGAAAMAVLDGAGLLASLRAGLGRLGRWGLRTDAVALALDLALGFVPVLCAQFDQLRDGRRAQDPGFAAGGPVARLRAYATLLAPLAAGAFAYADAVADGLASS